ncbi:hypothetical protein MKX70_20080 [Paenibacillus sp. FSL R7-0312]|uniref:hypothetical protein n=1 Tax=Paenibacillus sp. FSL R7-0312 TaxID=2921682 RepID=UPI0030F5AF66
MRNPSEMAIEVIKKGIVEFFEAGYKYIYVSGVCAIIGMILIGFGYGGIGTFIVFGLSILTLFAAMIVGLIKSVSEAIIFSKKFEDDDDKRNKSAQKYKHTQEVKAKA